MDLLATKFHNPVIVRHLTPRPRLHACLEESLLDGYRLVLVTAPAGFGKSTLVSAWLNDQPTPSAWLSLDSNDNDPRQFLSYFLGALQKIDERIGESLVNRIQIVDPTAGQAVYADIMADLVNEVAAFPGSFILVMDDCHQLKNPALLQLLVFLIERQPPQMHLILLTREDLPLPVSRLRVRRQLVEIRQADLQFTPEEAQDFLCSGMGLTQLSLQDVLLLGERTEGWIAGLQLTALSLKSNPNPSQFIQSFTGSSRYILDYLMDEVLAHQPEEIQDFLLSSAMLERFCAPLCATVLAEYKDLPVNSVEQAQGLLELAEHSNLFLIPLDNERQWYRFHHLFSDLLRHLLLRKAGEKVCLLHLRASQWLEANGWVQEAVQHGFLAQDWQYAAELVERHAWDMILHSRVGTVSEWCSHFPEHIISKHPALCVLHSWGLVLPYKQDYLPAATTRLDQAEACLASIDPEECAPLVKGAPPVHLQSWVRGQITLLRSYILSASPRNQADPQALLELGELSYNQLPAEDVSARSAALLDICYASQARSDAEEADRKLKHAAVIALNGGNYFGAVVSDYHRAHGMFTQGNLHEVIHFCNQQKKIYESHFANPTQELPAIALLDEAMGCTLLEMNELADAEACLRGGLAVGQWKPREEVPGYLALARLYAVTGDFKGMEDTLRRQEMRWPDIHYCTEAILLMYGLKSQPDDPEKRALASRWATENPPEVGPEILLPGIGPAWNDEADYAIYTAWAQIQILLGCPSPALRVIESLLEVATQHHLLHRQIELSLFQAQAFSLIGPLDRAWKPLRSALLLAEPAGYLRLIDQGPILVRLLLQARVLGMAPHYISRLLDIETDLSAQMDIANFPATPPGTGKLVSEGLVEPVSSREIEVLCLMAEGLSNAEIAARLYLSPNTLKAHTQNIYGKLDAHTRGQAVYKARELKII